MVGKRKETIMMLLLFPYKCPYSLSPLTCERLLEARSQSENSFTYFFCNSARLLHFPVLTIHCKQESLAPSADFAWLFWFWSLFHQCKNQKMSTLQPNICFPLTSTLQPDICFPLTSTLQPDICFPLTSALQPDICFPLTCHRTHWLSILKPCYT